MEKKYQDALDRIEELSKEEAEEYCEEMQKEYYELCGDYGARSSEANAFRVDCRVFFNAVAALHNIVYIV